jgi:hypothetical protein
MAFALVLSRQPTDIFTYKTGVHDNPKKMQFAVEQGRFGTLVLFKVGQVTEVQLLKGSEQGATSAVVPGGRLEIAYSGELQEVARYTTIERFDHNMVSMPRRREPYPITWESNNPVVQHLGPTKGHCFRVHGGKTPAQQGILIHAAPHVGWLTGCISPRRLGDKSLITDSTYAAMDDLHARIANGHADLFITDS